MKPEVTSNQCSVLSRGPGTSHSFGRLFAVLSTLGLMLIGCIDHDAKARAFLAKEIALMDGYYGTDTNVAEKSLVETIQHLLEGQSQRVEKRNYDYSLGLTHGRLALLYRRLGKAVEAEEHFHSAIRFMDRFVAARGVAASGTEPERRESLTRLIATLDRNREVKWKTQFHAIDDPSLTNRHSADVGKQ